MEILPNYLGHIQAHPNTAMAHYLGAYVVQTALGTRIPFVVMSNVFSGSRPDPQPQTLDTNSHWTM